uniref:DAO domain-containing protein n=1 Tax=Angiostrongylus cantonensis TaxID=6313 RepID=A0A0K0D2Q8_ANGCA
MTIYTSGAGITAAAGTRLALHWILEKRPLSGVEPLFSVTSNNHGRLIDYHQVNRADTFSDYR